MKKVSFRASSVMLAALLIIVGTALYIVRFVGHGADWALYFDESISSSVYLLSDRNGVMLAKMGEGANVYAEDSDTRIACYHLVGDYNGNVGTGALSVFRRELSDYNLITGIRESGDKELKLTVDSRLNKIAYEALDGRNGAVIMCNYKTGEVLCMVSSSSIDPVNPPEELPDGAYINRCISSSFTPGSVFKIITLTAALENIDDLFDRTFTCQGYIDVKGVKVTCTGVHGTETIEQAFANSCNCVFGQLALELGADTLAEYADKLGITGTHTLDGSTTAAGNFDKDESNSAALAWSGIGQYNDLVCPYSMLRIAAAIANGGVLNEPSTLGESKNTAKLISAKTAEKLSEMMNYNVSYHYGTSNFPGLNISAKTGTAELGGDKSPHGWFVGFLNDDAHPYAFAVIVENGGTGLHSAGKVANTLLQAAVG